MEYPEKRIIKLIDDETGDQCGECEYTRSDIAAEAERKAWNAAIEAAADIFRWNESDIHPVKRRHIRELILAFRR